MAGCGVAGFLEICWSDELLREVERIRMREFGDSSLEASRRTDLVRAAFPGSRIDAGWIGRAGANGLVHDAHDAHVAAVAMCVAPSMLITRDLRGYRCGPLVKRGVDVVTPDRHLLALYDAASQDVVRALSEQVAATRHVADVHGLLSAIARAGERQFARRLCTELGLPAPLLRRGRRPG